MQLFSAEVRDELIGRYGNSPASADAGVRFFLPDVLALDTENVGGFPNGRRPEDDAMDTMLQIITGNPSMTDGVTRNDRLLEATFPYFGLQHTPDEDPAPKG